LLNRLAPLVDHARAHRLQHVELTLPGIHLTDADSSGTQSAFLQQPLTAWPGLELKVNAIDFSFLCTPAGNWASAATQVGNCTAGGPRGSHVRLLGLLAYEALGGSRARVEATGRYAPVAAIGEEGNAVLRRALADEWPSGGELTRQLAASVGDAGPTAPVPEGDAAGGGREALPQPAPADALKKRPSREKRATCGALALGLVVLVGLGGYAWHRTNHHPRLPATGAPARSTLTPGPSSPAAPAPAVAWAATPAWGTVPPTASGDPQPTPSPGEAEWVAADVDTRDLTLSPAAASPGASPAETPVETTPVPEGVSDATPRAAVLPAPPASQPAALDNAAANPDKVPEGGSERLQGSPGAVRARQDDPPAAFTPAPLRPKARGRHGYRPRPPVRPQPQPTFWQRLFGHKETTKPKPAKPRP
jgi:hypothetical protein